MSEESVEKETRIQLGQQEMSPTIGKLAEALSAAQGEMGGAVKDSSNPFFKSKYADLQAVWEAARGPLSKNGLSVIQTTEPDDMSVTVVTLLAHKSGEWIRGKLRMRPQKQDPQGIGACISYARRYAMAAICGIYQMDDDAESAVKRDGEKSSGKKKKSTPATDEQQKKLADLAKEHGWDKEELRKMFKQAFDINSFSEITQESIEAIEEVIKDAPHGGAGGKGDIAI